MSEARFCWCPEHGRVPLELVRMFYDEHVQRLTLVGVDPKGKLTQEPEDFWCDADLNDFRIFHLIAGSESDECSHSLDDETLTEAECAEREARPVLAHCTACHAAITDPDHMIFKEQTTFKVRTAYDKVLQETVITREYGCRSFGFWHNNGCGGRLETELHDVDVYPMR